MGILNHNAESFDLTVRDIAKRVDVDVWCNFESLPRPYKPIDCQLQLKRLQEMLSKRLVDEIANIQSPNPSSIQVRKVIQDVLGCKVSVRKKPWFFRKGANLSYFYDITLKSDMHTNACKHFIPEVIVNSCGLGIDEKVILESIGIVHIVLKQLSPSNYYKF